MRQEALALGRRCWRSGLACSSPPALPAGPSSGAKAGTHAAKGGTLQVNLSHRHRLLDPALDYLVDRLEHRVLDLRQAAQLPGQARRRRARSSSPEAAAGFPTISNDGKTYTFTVRRAFKFSDRRSP